jgi:outer membrane lipoprotein SlyB
MLATVLLPNPAEPGTIAMGALIGGFLAETISRVTGRPPADNRMQWAIEGSYYGTGVAICAYLAASAHNAGLF